MTSLNTAVTWTDPQREAAFDQWLSDLSEPHGLVTGSLRPASADASFRRYLRIDTTDGGTRIIMDAPPEKENCKPFVQVAELMKDAGLLVPDILAWDEPQGFMLLPDLGQQTWMEQIQPEAPCGQLRALHAGHRHAAGLAAGVQARRAAGLRRAAAAPRTAAVPRLVSAASTKASRWTAKTPTPCKRPSTPSSSATWPRPASMCTATSCRAT